MTEVNVTLLSSRLGPKNCKLVSDRLGKIYLGKLPHILSVECSASHENVTRTWNVYEASSDTWSYPTEINIIENGSVEIPIANMWDPETPMVLSRNHMSFYRTLEDLVIEDCFSKIELVPKQH